MQKITSVSLGVALCFVLACGGSNTSSGGTGSGTGAGGVAGSYEFVATSNQTLGSTTLIEANLAANGSNSSASGASQVQTATYINGVWYVNGACPSSSEGQNSVTGSMSGSSITLTFNEGGNVFTGQGTVTGTTVTGTYSGSNANCSDSGNFTGTLVPNLSGTFAGTLFFSYGADDVAATLTEGNGNALTFQTALSGADNGNFTFSGTAVANVMFVSGSVGGNSFSLFGYFDKTGAYTGVPNSIAVFDYQTLDYLGLLENQGSRKNLRKETGRPDSHFIL